jgi:hypothetical protein|tara:strand:- start:385 stop:615 length:231 start_codon:yes stop_codon:yes gene_type:complete
MDKPDNNALAQWIVQMNNTMKHIETFGQTAVESIEQVAVVLRDHESRIHALEKSLSGLVDEGKELMGAIEEYIKRQ